MSAGENIQAAFSKFIDSKYAQFDQENLRAANQELAAMIQQVALVTSISDEQKKQLFAAQEELKKKEQEVFYRRQEYQRREAELNKNRQELEEAKAARRQAEERNRPQAEVQALKTREQAAAKQVYVSTQNHANASKAAKESAMAGVAQTVTTYNNVASQVNQAAKTVPRQAEGQNRPQVAVQASKPREQAAAKQAYVPPQSQANVPKAAKGSSMGEVVQGINTYNEVASQVNQLSSELGLAAEVLPVVPRALPRVLSTFGSLFD